MKDSRQKAVGSRQYHDALQRDCARAAPLARWRSVLVIFCLLPTAFCLLNCGKRRPPLPPIERVQQRTELLSGVQRGNQVILSWPAPLRNAPEGSVQSIRRIDVYRLAEKPRAPLGLTEEEFATRSTLIGSVTYDEIKGAPGGVITYADTLELAGEPARLRYAIRYVNASGQRAAFSNFLLLEPAARIAQPPTIIATGREVGEDAITISWQPPAANIDGSTPVNLLGYNVYRVAESESDVSQPMNDSLVSGTQYRDQNFKFGEGYRYVVRAVSLGTEGAQVESLNSNSISVSPRDTFQPSAPASITVAAAPGRLSIFFPANPEADIAGYNLYRSTDPDLPKEKWNKLNATLLTRTTFQDEKVESGKKYYYYLIAVDQAGNISPLSEVVSETVP